MTPRRLSIRFLGPALALLLLAPAAGAMLPGWHSTVDAAVEDARDKNGYILVDLYAEWCGWCKVLEKDVFSTPEFRDFARDFALLHVDVEDRAEGSELQERYGVTSLPTTLILDASMVKVGEVRGFAPKTQFLASVSREIERHKALLSFFDTARVSNDTEIQRQLAADLHERGDGARAAELYERILERHGGDPGPAAWLYYLAADAHRMGGALDRAASRVKRARSMADGVGDTRLLEQIGLLEFLIAQDSGDCHAAMASLERFLDTYPRSSHTSRARRTLNAIKRGEVMECTS